MHKTEVLCPKNRKGDITFTCPALFTAPQCTKYDDFDYSVNPDCDVLEFTSHNTTCCCQGATARRYLQSSGNAAVEFSTRLGAISSNFGETFISAPSLTDVKRNLVILSTL